MTGVTDDELDVFEDTQQGRYLIFTVGREDFGIPIVQVVEIIGIQEITTVPELPGHVVGVINLRGKIIPVLDMRLRFKLEPMAYNDRTCIIVVNIDAVTVGLIVDHVAEVIRIDEENIAPPPDAKLGFHSRYIKALGKVGDDVKLLLDCEKLLTEGEIAESGSVA